MSLHHVSWRPCCGCETSNTRLWRSPQQTDVAACHAQQEQQGSHVSLLADGSVMEKNRRLPSSNVSMLSNLAHWPETCGTWSRASWRVTAWKLPRIAGEDSCGSPTCWAWVPLEHREAVVAVHVVTDRVGEGNVPRKAWGHQVETRDAHQAPASERVHSLRGQQHACGCAFPPERYQLRASVVWAVERPCARCEDERLWHDKNDCPGRWGRSTWEKRGNPQWVVREAFTTSRY